MLNRENINAYERTIREGIDISVSNMRPSNPNGYFDFLINYNYRLGALKGCRSIMRLQDTKPREWESVYAIQMETIRDHKDDVPYSPEFGIEKIGEYDVESINAIKVLEISEADYAKLQAQLAYKMGFISTRLFIDETTDAEFNVL